MDFRIFLHFYLYTDALTRQNTNLQNCRYPLFKKYIKSSPLSNYLSDDELKEINSVCFAHDINSLYVFQADNKISHGFT